MLNRIQKLSSQTKNTIRWTYNRYPRYWKWFLILGIVFLTVFKHIPSAFLDSDPYSVSRFQHGYIKSVPTFMTSNESYRESNQVLNLLPSLIPLTVHVIWCQPKTFQFENYLSVLSAYRFLKPTRIIFHYFQKPELDAFGYYQFYAKMVHTLPNLVQEPIQRCRDEQEKLSLILAILNETGGIYIGERVILASSLIRYRNLQLSYSSGTLDTWLVMMTKQQRKSVGRPSAGDINKLLKSSPSKVNCIDVENFNTISKPDCILLKDQLFPADIFTLDTEFGRMARWIYYGHKALKSPKEQDELIPLIVHYVWLGKHSFKFFDYLSLLSAVYVLTAEVVYVHGDVKPEGPHWEAAERIPNVKFIFREFPASVFGNDIVAYASHASDVLRSDLLIRYGGIYMDWDVIWVNSLPNYIRRYDAVFGVDWPSTGEFPDIFNMGVVLGQQGSRFLQYFLESYRHYLDKDWVYNAVWIPYKVYEQHSDLAYVDRHLQVICAEGKCHPSWMPGYKQYHHLNKLRFDWRHETLSMHWTYPDPEEFSSRSALLQSESMFGDIGKFVLMKAGLI